MVALQEQSKKSDSKKSITLIYNVEKMSERIFTFKLVNESKETWPVWQVYLLIELFPKGIIRDAIRGGANTISLDIGLDDFQRFWEHRCREDWCGKHIQCNNQSVVGIYQTLGLERPDDSGLICLPPI